jgi:CRISPR-associated protein Csd1
MIKAFLNRLHRYNPKTSILDEEIQVALDRDLKDASYCLGRLFAVLERVQEEYNPDIKATIRATYWGAASSAPKTTFHLLLNLANKHLLGIRREKPGRATNLEKLIGEIIDNLDPRQPFPSSLETDRQGLFAVGYWHQKQHPSTYKTQGESA